MNEVVCAVTMGDPAGIGPEILLQAARNADVTGRVRVVAIADFDTLNAASDVVEDAPELYRLTDVSRGAIRNAPPGVLPVLDLNNVSVKTLARGTVRGEYGQAAYDSISRSIELAQAGVVDAVVTNPIHKEAIRAAGIQEPGHTEIFARLTNTTDYAMMLAHGQLRVVHVSTHVSLRQACDAVKRARVERVIRLAADAVSRLEERDLPIAVAGLNPHAGEHGLFGTEEEEEIIPAIDAARRDGLSVVGPFPPDTLFPRGLSGEFSAIVVMYHDQGHIPLKLSGFRVDPETGTFSDVSGINVTLGLPIIRTSVDHGTAFDLAGTGRASPASLVQAIIYAGRLAGVGTTG